MLIFENFISRYENFKSRVLSSTRKLTRHSDMDDTLNVWMLRHSRHHAAQLWLGGGPWEVKRQGKLWWRSEITKRSRLSHSSFQTSRQTAVVPRPTINSPRDWQVGPCVQLMEVSVSDIRVVLQILIGNRCSVDKGRIQPACSLFIDAAPR